MREKDLEQKYNSLFNSLVSSRGDWLERAIEAEDFYYSDVEGTFTQYKREQLEKLKKKYAINVSIDILLPLVEQMISILVNTNPSARIVPVGNEDKDIAYLLNDIFAKIWKDSKADIEIESAITDSVITGSGFVIVEPVTAYDTNKLRIKISHVPYTDVLVDPASRKWDFSDASVICIAKPVKLQYAMDVYGIKEDASYLTVESISQDPAFRGYNFVGFDSKQRIVWVKDFYEKQIVNGEIEVNGVRIPYQKPTIVRTIQVGSKIIYRGNLPLDEYPIVHFPFIHRRSNRTYGMVHFLIDLQKATNKFIDLTIYNAQLGSNFRYMTPEGAIVNKEKWEQEASAPGVVLEYRPDPNLPNGGRPEVVMPQPLNQAFYTLFNASVQLAEYVSGIFGVIQGNSNRTPDVYSTVASLQNMGVQRIKNKARKYDVQIGRIAKICLKYVQSLLPRDVILRYVSDEYKLTAIEKLNDILTVDFDVETSSNPSTPTVRQFTAQVLSNVAGNIGDPNYSIALLEEIINLLDVPEADRILQKISVIDNLNSRISQLTALIEEQNAMIKRLRKKLEDAQIDIERIKAGKEIENEETNETEVKNEFKTAENINLD